MDYYDEALKLLKLFVSHAGHYSWEKNLDILGLGKKNVCRVNVDRKFRLDIEQLTTQIASRPDQAILMVVGVVGTTEEGAIDPIEALATMNIQDKDFYFHIDGAYGGYFCSMVAESAQPVINESLNKLYESILPEIEADLLAVSLSHSIAIDPHKLGYVPMRHERYSLLT